MPYVSVHVDLDDFDDDDLIRELENRGYECAKSGALRASIDSRVDHLLDCGMDKAAAEELLQLAEQSRGLDGRLTKFLTYTHH